MHDAEPLGPGNIHYYASLVAEGTATPSEARSLLVEFVRQARTHPGRIDARLIEHLADCIGAFLDGKKVLVAAPEAGRDGPHGIPVSSLDKALGLKRIAPGNPATTEDELSRVAADVLAELLRFETKAGAYRKVATRRKGKGQTITSRSQVEAAWKAHARDALLYLRAERLGDGKDWTDAEVKLLCQVYRRVPGVTIPSEQTYEGRPGAPRISPKN